jgi:formylglycine-generating enzyme required for sulfatase activity
MLYPRCKVIQTAESPSNVPILPATRHAHVRGGSRWALHPAVLRTTFRLFSDLTLRHAIVGFRCAHTVT